MLPGGEVSGRAASRFTPSMRHPAVKYITRMKEKERISSYPRNSAAGAFAAWRLAVPMEGRRLVTARHQSGPVDKLDPGRFRRHGADREEFPPGGDFPQANAIRSRRE